MGGRWWVGGGWAVIIPSALLLLFLKWDKVEFRDLSRDEQEPSLTKRSKFLHDFTDVEYLPVYCPRKMFYIWIHQYSLVFDFYSFSPHKLHFLFIWLAPDIISTRKLLKLCFDGISFWHPLGRKLSGTMSPLGFSYNYSNFNKFIFSD